MPVIAEAATCYDIKWAVLPGSPLEMKGKTPQEVCDQARYTQQLAYPIQIFESLVPTSWGSPINKLVPIRYSCSWKLYNQAGTYVKTQVTSISHYRKPIGTSEQAWAYGDIGGDDDCTVCPGCSGFSAGSGFSKTGGKGFGFESAGHPITYIDAQKAKVSVDWMSSRDARFAFTRYYSSSLEGNYSYSEESFGKSWGSSFERTIWQRGNYHLLYLEQGKRRKFFGDQSGSFSAILKDHSYILARENLGNSSTATLRGSDGTGREEVFTEYLNTNTTSGTDRFLKLSEIRWADGYKITILRNAQKRISIIQDNKGQRAEFLWFEQPGSSPLVAVVDKILIDTQYNGSTLQPDIEIDYGYTTVAGYNFAVLAQTAQTKDLNTSAILSSVTYQYDTTSGVSPAKLVSVKDGRLDVNGQPFAAQLYTYGKQAANGLDIATSTSLAGNVQTFSTQMNAAGDVTFTNPKGKTTTFDIEIKEGRKRVVLVQGAATQNSLGAAVSASYIAPVGMAKGWVYSETLRNGSKTDFTRDARGLILTKTEDAAGLTPKITTYTWTTALRLPLTRTTTSLRETFVYTTKGLLTSYSQKDMLVGSPTNGQIRTWTYGYTTLTNGLQVLTTVNGPGLTANGINDVTTYTYNSVGALETVTDAIGLVTTVIARNDQGQPTIVEEPNKNRWTFSYDQMGRVVTSGMAGPGLTPLLYSFNYDIAGQLTSYTNTRGKTWTFSYDLAKQLSKATAPNGDSTNFTYDVAGNVTRTEYKNGTGPVAFWEEAQFDELGRVLKTIGAQGQQWNFSHDKEDNLTGEIDPLNNASTSSFDALNRMTGMVDRENYTSGQTFNPADQLIEYTDPRQIKTNFVYNGFGEVISEVSADRGSISYTYDQRGLVTSRTDGRGVTVNYAYDNGGRLALIDYPAGGISDVTFTYDQIFLGGAVDANKGSVGRIVDSAVTTSFERTPQAAQNVLTTTALYPNSRTYSVMEEYDFEGNLTGLTYPSGKKITYDIGDDNEITAVKLTDASVLTTLVGWITYKPNGPMASMTYGDGATQTRTYDNSYRLTGITDIKGAISLRNMTYGYETRDNLTAVTDTLLPANSETYAYTPRESLTSATGPYGQMAFTYDGVGNRVTYGVNPGAGLVTDTYAYPATSNRLSTISLGAGGNRAFTYDAAGNVTFDDRTGGGYGYTYDAAGRMATFSINGILQANYKYDFAGRQVVRELSGGAVIHSVFDADGNRIAEYDQTSGALIREYVWFDGAAIAVIEGGVVYYIRSDHIGRPVFATNAAGVQVWSASYLPFGGVRTPIGTPITLRFPGQWFQSESGLHQNWMRDYDPTTGRYLQADPLGLVDGASVYGYARQSPGRYTDPTGEFIPILVGALIGAGLDLGVQLYMNGGDLRCVNWGQVGLSGALGAFSGGWGSAWKLGATGLGRTGAATQTAYRNAYRIGTEYRVHHSIFSAGGKAARASTGFQHSWWNYRSVLNSAHKGLHRYKTVKPLGPFKRWRYGTPEWLIGAEISAYTGGALEFLDGPCDCGN